MSDKLVYYLGPEDGERWRSSLQLSENQKALLEIQRDGLHEAFLLHKEGDYEGSKKITSELRKWMKNLRRRT